MARPTTPGSQRGALLLALLILVAAMGAALATAGTFWHDIRHREKERELLFVGLQYRNAIRQYYEAPGAAGTYPPNLEALLQDPRFPGTRRYLRRPWRDPMTDKPEWGLVMAPQGGIMGIYSLSPETPIKRAGFPAVLEWNAGMGSYADWKFVYVPKQATAAGR